MAQGTVSSPLSADVKIRQYQSCDQEQVVQLYVAGIRDYEHNYGEPRDDTLAFWESFIQKSLRDDLEKIEQVYLALGGNFWVATVAGDANGDGKEKVVGMVALEKKADGEGKLRRMSVSSEYRRFGLGRCLVALLEAWAKENAFKRVELSTGSIMPNALRFYPSVGYAYVRSEVLQAELGYELVYFAKTL
ncbi:hypothetical protein PybrP1_010855 [[Pythium] brassicae (nom. inval.)]|nr:hypothetical protein PybrP1_010855 [[Pythium] brassicae (nom. inval.)]